jgi:DNA polymerase epsilon subunit 1
MFQPVVESNWNIGRFLPEAGACQTNFKMIIAGYIMLVYEILTSEHLTPGSTPVKAHSSQTQVRSSLID